MVPCKVCESEFKSLIEDMILKGESNNAIANELKIKGMDISHASINRHKSKHMIEHKKTIDLNSNDKGNRKYDREDSKNSFLIDINEIYQDGKEKISQSLTYDELAENNKIITVLLNRILINQLTITITLQEKYMKGETKYPNEQVRGLQIIQEINQKYDDSTRKTFSHLKTIFDSKDAAFAHIEKMGMKAKRKLAEKQPYKKGMLFKNFDCYETVYNPVCPYSYMENREEYKAFHLGVKKARCEIEELDNLIYFLYERYAEKNPLFDISEKIQDLQKEYNQIDEIEKIKLLMNS